MADFEGKIYDIAIIGGGPVGLFAAFYAGMRGASTIIADSLEELGGELMAIYPEKYIYDIAGFPAVLAKDYVEPAIEQALSMGAEVTLRTEVTGLTRDDDENLIYLDTTRGRIVARTVIICAGIGAFEPKRLEVEGIERFEGGKGVHYFAKRIEDFRDKRVLIVGGGDSAVDWAVTLGPIAKHVTLIHRSKFRAHEHTVKQLLDGPADVFFPGYVATAVHGDERLEAVTYQNTETGEETTIEVDEMICAIGFKADLGPLKTWGLETERNQIVVDKITMQTNIPGVFGAGDIVTYPAKFRLIATGVAEAVTAVNHAVIHYNPDARLDPGHSTNIMEKKAREAEKAARAREAVAASDD
ncbi:MAG TPA: NAD(P)/FAD-dependent oxidoreductase [Thermomicrobiales bacterium]|nr:NAD(P)/FAD-dependent oxidoreductase [Thermomicrobiales bacterium]